VGDSSSTKVSNSVLNRVLQLAQDKVYNLIPSKKADMRELPFIPACHTPRIELGRLLTPFVEVDITSDLPGYKMIMGPETPTHTLWLIWKILQNPIHVFSVFSASLYAIHILNCANQGDEILFKVENKSNPNIVLGAKKCNVVLANSGVIVNVIVPPDAWFQLPAASQEL
jgi:hypothetical protein